MRAFDNGKFAETFSFDKENNLRKLIFTEKKISKSSERG